MLLEEAEEAGLTSLSLSGPQAAARPLLPIDPAPAAEMDLTKARALAPENLPTDPDPAQRLEADLDPNLEIELDSPGEAIVYWLWKLRKETFAAFHAPKAVIDRDPAINQTTTRDPNRDLFAAEERRSMLFTTSPSMSLGKDTCLKRSKTNCTNTRHTTEATLDAVRT